MSTPPPLIVGVGGTLRDGSTSQRALQLALASAEELGAATRMFAGSALNLDPFDPGDPHRSEETIALVDALRKSDGVILSSPCYHGSISGLLKNALDYTEDLRCDQRPYLSDRAVGLIVCADGIQAMGSTLATLRAIVHALRGWPTPSAATINSAQRPFDASGACRQAETQDQVRRVAEQVVEVAFLRRQAAAGAAQSVN
jgi:FMN reductase